jgi:predicted N-acetyltransferase YhbS
MATLVNRPVTTADGPAIAALHARVFGPGRFVRTAYRIREGHGAEFSPCCLLAHLDGALVAAIRFTPITIGGVGHALMLGPLAVETVHAGKGYGKQLVAEGLAKARNAGIRLVVLVGDTNYYERFGFVPVPPGQISLPGPADPRRILAAELAPGALADYRGLVAPDRGA